MRKMNDIGLFVEVDLEGVSGVVYGGYGLPYAGGNRKETELLMTLEANALVEGACQAGAGRVLLQQSHPFQREYLAGGCEVVHDSAQLPGCGALAFLGRHARAGVPDAVFSHTGSSRSVLSLRVNGVEFGEFGMFAALAGSYGVPAIFVSGDAAAAREAKSLVPDIETAVVSEGFGNHGALCASPRRAHRLIREGIERALARRDSIPPLVVPGPVTVEYTFLYPAQAARFARVSGVSQKDGRTAVYTASDYQEAYRMYRAASLPLIWWDYPRGTGI